MRAAPTLTKDTGFSVDGSGPGNFENISTSGFVIHGGSSTGKRWSGTVLCDGEL